MTLPRPNLNNLDFIGRAEDFVEEFDFDRDLLKDVVRFPTSREKDPHSLEVGYPIYRFRRGDITVTVSFRDLENPHILHVRLHNPDEVFVPTDKTAGGGGAKGKKNPQSINQIKGWLQAEGCRLIWQGANSTQRVTYNGAYIGTLHQTVGSAASVQSTYTRLRRKLSGVKKSQQVQAALVEDIKNREMK